MAELRWYYHVAYVCKLPAGLYYGDTAVTTPWRIDNDERLRAVREQAAELARRSPDDVVITNITLLARARPAEQDGDDR